MPELSQTPRVIQENWSHRSKAEVEVRNNCSHFKQEIVIQSKYEPPKEKLGIEKQVKSDFKKAKAI